MNLIAVIIDEFNVFFSLSFYFETIQPTNWCSTQMFSKMSCSVFRTANSFDWVWASESSQCERRLSRKWIKFRPSLLKFNIRHETHWQPLVSNGTFRIAWNIAAFKGAPEETRERVGRKDARVVWGCGGNGRKSKLKSSAMHTGSYLFCVCENGKLVDFLESWSSPDVKCRILWKWRRNMLFRGDGFLFDSNIFFYLHFHAWHDLISIRICTISFWALKSIECCCAGPRRAAKQQCREMLFAELSSANPMVASTVFHRPPPKWRLSNAMTNVWES